MPAKLVKPQSDEHFDPIRCPERNLLSAILERAIADALPSSNLLVPSDSPDVIETTGELSASAWRWILADRTKRAPSMWSFAWVCQHLDLDADILAAALRSMKGKGVKFYRERDARPKASQARRRAVG